MKDELQQTYPIVTEITNLDQYGYLKPSGYQQLINKMIEQHLIKFHLSFEELSPLGLSWVIISLSIEIKKPIQGCQTVYGTTWHAQRKGICFRREIQIKDSAGNVVCNAAMSSILFDIATRSIFKKRELPFVLGEATETLLLSANTSFKERHIYTDVAHRKVQRSYIDCLGHVNNCRYGEFGFDSLSDDEAKMEKMKRIDIYFLSELRPEDCFVTQKATEENRVMIQGYNETAKKVSFHTIFTY